LYDLLPDEISNNFKKRINCQINIFSEKSSIFLRRKISEKFDEKNKIDMMIARKMG